MLADMMVVIIESCVRASVVLCAAWALTSMMRRTSAATRHFVWSCAIAGAILASALSSFGPRWPVTICGNSWSRRASAPKKRRR